VRIDGRDVTRDPDYRRAHAIARVFDDPLRGTAPTLSIEENLALALAQGKRSLRFALNERRRKIMCEALEQLGLGLENRLTDTVQLLSAGQRQSLTLVMASLRQPSVLLLDEHVAALDPRTQKTVLDITVALVGRLRCTTVMVTHNMNHAIAFGDRLLVMSRGEVIADFPHAEKTNLTTERLVLHIAEVGDVVSDRMYLMEHDGHSNVKRTKSL
jgi:putative ABC transport system ATP-binding protein